MMNENVSALAAVLREAEKAHAESEKGLPAFPPIAVAWPEWYAEYMLKTGKVVVKEAGAVCW